MNQYFIYRFGSKFEVIESWRDGYSEIDFALVNIPLMVNIHTDV